jgi:phosphoenolpyruvate carboxykinase (ATP)
MGSVSMDPETTLQPHSDLTSDSADPQTAAYAQPSNDHREDGMKIRNRLDQLLAWLSRPGSGCNVHVNTPRARLIREAVQHREARVAACGALATWSPPESTGRSPKDTVTVSRPDNDGTIDWDSPYANAIDPETMDMAIEDALKVLEGKPDIYVIDRVIGADPRYALPVRLVTDRALTALFADNMFRQVPQDLDASVFADRPFLLIALPYDKLDPTRYQGRHRVDPKTGETSGMLVASDYERAVGLVYGSAYCGSVKKLMFTAMNYYLPEQGILPLHCSANEGPEGDVSLLLGLSGTGKTTLSADPQRALLGDDEHGWSDHGVANFEGGCYAKLIDLDQDKEPEIHHAITHHAPFVAHGAIVENAMMHADGTFDFFDSRLTPNSRGSYPLYFLHHIKRPPFGPHANTILFLTADANGVLPPVARLSEEQAKLWFLMGYTSKLAGTETGVVEPVTTFSRFFGEPFMPRNPSDYMRLLGEKLDQHRTAVYLVNTGWSGGPYGVGERMDIALTRAIVHAAQQGELARVPVVHDPLFHLDVPTECPGIEDPSVLQPINTWADPEAYEQRAKKLAGEFAAHFDKVYGDKPIDPAIAACCPGK